VTELDAASHTGIGDMRELQEGMMFGPSASRFKVYILDEAHMLSGAGVELDAEDRRGAAAAREVRLRHHRGAQGAGDGALALPAVRPAAGGARGAGRAPGEICRRERVEAEPEALALIARAAEGSVRDSLSLLDQAIALSEVPPVAAATVQEMLGLGDRLRVLDLFDAVMRGAAPEVLDRFGELHGLGVDPAALVQDLLDVCHA
jgi:DNA polymerase-3 subunit gamma/tau